MLKGLSLDPNLDAIGTTPADAQPQATDIGPATSAQPALSLTANGKSKLDIPYKAERDNFMKCVASETGVIGIRAMNEKDARRIRTKHYRARMQLHANDVSMFNNIVVQVELRGAQWYCTLTFHPAYQIDELPPIANAASIENALGIEDENEA